MRLLKNVALAAAIAVSVVFMGACAEEVPPTTTTTEYSTTAPAVYVAPPPITTSSTTTTTQYPNGTVMSTTPGYSTVVTGAPVVMAPSPVLAPVVMAPGPVETTTSSNWGNGTTVQKRTTTSADGSVQKQTTTSWDGNGNNPSQTSTTTTTSPY